MIIHDVKVLKDMLWKRKFEKRRAPLEYFPKGNMAIGVTDFRYREKTLWETLARIQALFTPSSLS
jgi:hypothetical protein